MRGRMAAALAVIATFSCARPLPPPGGDRDIEPPRLVATWPEPLEMVPASDREVVFFFDERISEGGFSEILVIVSPLDSALRVDRSGSEVRVSIDGGWRPDRVYRVVLLPGMRDLFGNIRNEATELVFSTGADVTSTALAGIVFDRVSGLPARQGIVNAVRAADSVRYMTIADSTGFYSLRYLPLGLYDVFAFDDQNRNRRKDPSEPVDSGYVAAFDVAADTVTLVFNVLGPDTTAPRVMRANSLDSLHVRVETDDPIGSGSFDRIRAEVHVLPDSTRYAGGIRVMAESDFIEQQRLARDSTAVPAQPVSLPTRQLVIVLDRPLLPGLYTITLRGVTNLHGLIGDGLAPFEMVEAAPPTLPDTVPPTLPDTVPPTDTIPRRDTIPPYPRLLRR